jgi:hypothetical protein
MGRIFLKLVFGGILGKNSEMGNPFNFTNFFAKPTIPWFQSLLIGNCTHLVESGCLIVIFGSFNSPEKLFVACS